MELSSIDFRPQWITSIANNAITGSGKTQAAYLYAVQAVHQKLVELEEIEIKEGIDAAFISDGKIFYYQCKSTQMPVNSGTSILTQEYASLVDQKRCDIFPENFRQKADSLFSHHALQHFNISAQSYASFLRELYTIFHPSYLKILDVAHIHRKKSRFQRQKKALKKLIHLLISLQYIAKETHNRISKSPTPFKKEPPIGGIKVGGKQHTHRHAA